MSVRAFIDTNIIYLHDTTAGRKREAAKQLVADLWHQGVGCQAFGLDGTYPQPTPSSRSNFTGHHSFHSGTQ